MSSPYIGPSLSAGTPFLNTLPAAISAANDNFVDPKSTSAPPPAHEQKGLSRSNAAGLKAAQSSLSAHDGGILSGLQSPASAHATVTPDTDKGPPLGPPSTDRVITHAVTLPEGALGASADTPVIAYTTATPADNQNSGSDDRATPGPETAVTTFMHFGMQPDPKYETAAPMTKRATKNIAILADAVRATETEVADLATKLGNLTVELRLGERASTAAQLLTTPPPTRSRSDSQTSQDNDISELFHRVREVKLTVSESATEGAELAEHVSALEEDLTARVSALEDRPSDGLTVSALSTAVAERFGEITTDRNALDTAMRNQFETQLKATAQLRLENKDLRKTLEAMQTTIERNTIKYLVKWTEYGPEDNSWVLASDAENAPSLIKDYLEERTLKSSPSRLTGTKCLRKSMVDDTSDAEGLPSVAKKSRVSQYGGAGLWDFGVDGIETFINTHECNRLCTELRFDQTYPLQLPENVLGPDNTDKSSSEGRHGSPDKEE
ncbi:hypothetical protein B0H13DRAFT_2383583 [Mycena leptocephala]|nr:hypothetical protein B0H13DRAFT_2383583 [Mycena leptocephala]